MNKTIHRYVCLLVCVGAGCGASSTSSQPAPSNHSDSHGEVTVPAELSAGMEVYQQHCAMCHDEGEGGAARLGSERAWGKRIDKGIDVLTQNALEGFEGMWGEMPPQKEKASEPEVRSAVEYMIFRGTPPNP